MSTLHVEYVSTKAAFRKRIQLYVVKEATKAMDEVNTVDSHVERVAFAERVFVSDYDLNQYVLAVLSNATLLAALNRDAEDNGVTDGDLEFTVNSFYNAFAGVST